ncbi:ATP-binding protein [Nostoc sp. CALU 1950]|uniref:ATP-binding protein n=1 Tax=Nostoc sp. CALU 1950 TaxID=3104321 RepID=UPI003EBEEBE3
MVNPLMSKDLLLELFREAYRNLELQPLLSQKELDKFKVDYGNNIIEKLMLLVDDSPSGDCKIIFTGHRGCGKSTLLADFSRRYEKQYFMVFFSIGDTIEMSDVNHINILFTTAVNLIHEAEKHQISIPKSIKEVFSKWFATKTSIKENKLQGSASVGFDFKFISAKLKADNVTRNEIKQEFQNKISELVSHINEIAAVIQTETKKEIIVILDDLDKLDLGKINDLFKDNIKALCLPHFRIIFTIPIAALRDKFLKAILETETNYRIVLPVVKLLNKGETRESNILPILEAKTTLYDILKKRIPETILDTKTAEKIVLYSGGVLRELIRIANECCIICLGKVRRIKDNETLIINDIILEEAINNLRNDFATPLTKLDYEILQQIYQFNEPDDPNQGYFLELLHGLHVIEYHDYRNWYDIHPIVLELLRERKLI